MAIVKMKLLIVESPSKAKTINQYLGSEYDVLSSYGHIRALPSENGSVNTDEDFHMRFEVIERSKKHVDNIIKMYRKCSELLLATDPDREGEAIAWHILDEIKQRGLLDVKKPVHRVVFNEITKKAVLEAVSHPKKMNDSLVDAQKARQALDYLVGFTLSPVLWRKLPGSRSAGRVQSVALRILSDREEEIESFKPQEYWTIEWMFFKADAEDISSKLQVLNGKKLEKFSISTQKSAEDAVSLLMKTSYSVSNIDKKEIKRQPPPPFTTSTMLQEAAKKLGFSAKKTAKIAQDLYEGISVAGKSQGLITYMRTDSVSVSTDAISASRCVIEQKYGANYLEKSPRTFKNKSKNAQEAHEAIRPTDWSVTPEIAVTYLSADHYKLYNLIWRRMLASQMSCAIVDSVGIDISSCDNQHVFRATGSTIRFDGYLKLYPKQSDKSDEVILPLLSPGENLSCKSIEPKQHVTEPPARYTEANLVKKLEELGIGRPSTYPSIIAVLQDRGYVEVESKRFYALPKGRIVNAFLTSFFVRYVEYDFTAHLEDLLDDIATGKIGYKSVLQEFWGPFNETVKDVMEIKIPQILSGMEGKLGNYLYGQKDRLCSKCGVGKLELKNAKFGPFLGCSNYPACNNVEKIAGLESQDDTGGDMVFPKSLGLDELNIEYIMKKGPYGVYIEYKDAEGAIKRIPIPAGTNCAEIDLAYVKKINQLPRVVGVSDQYGQIKAGAGRFGPYVAFKDAALNKIVYVSIKKEDPFLIDLQKSEDFISKKIASRKDTDVAKPRKKAVKK